MKKLILVILMLFLNSFIFSQAKEDWVSDDLQFSGKFNYSVDGNILFEDGNIISLLNPKTGKTIWEVSLEESGTDLRFVPNSIFFELTGSVIKNTTASKKTKPKGLNGLKNMVGDSINKNIQEAKKSVNDLKNTTSSLKNTVKSGKLTLGSSDSEKIPSSRIRLYDIRNGKKVFDSENVISYQILQRTGNPLVFGYFNDNRNPSLALFDINTGSMIWESSKIFENSQKVKLGKFELKLEFDPNALTTPPLELSNNDILLTLKTGIFKLDGKTGEIAWNTPHPKKKGMYSTMGSSSSFDSMMDNPEDVVDKNIKMLLSPIEDTSFFYMDSYRITKLSLTDGSHLWDNEVKLKNPIDKVIYTEKGLILSPITGIGGSMLKAKLYYIAYDNGNAIWDNLFVNVKGGVKDYLFVNNNRLLLQLKDANNVNLLSLLDLKTGQNIFDKEKKLKGELIHVEEIDKGYLYYTTKEANVLSFTGEKLIKDKIGGENCLTDLYETDLYFYNVAKGSLSKIDLKNLSVSTVLKAPKLKSKDFYKHLKVTNDKIILSADRDISHFNKDGSLIKSESYQAPQVKGWVKLTTGIAYVALTGPAGVLSYGAAVAIDSVSGPKQGLDGAYANKFDKYAKQKANNSLDLYFSSDPIYKKIANRIEKSTQYDPYTVLLVDYETYSKSSENVLNIPETDEMYKKWKTYEKSNSSYKEIGLAVVNKLTQDIELLINVGNLKSYRYEISGLDNQFLFQKNIKYYDESFFDADGNKIGLKNIRKIAKANKVIDSGKDYKIRAYSF